MPRAADPVVETRHQVTRVCPAELLAPIAPRPERPAGGFVEGDPATLQWLGRLSEWGDGLAARLADAARQC